MLSPSAATVGKKLLVDDKITGCAKQISLGCYVKFRIGKHCLVKHFAINI